MSFALPKTSATTDPDLFYNWEISVPDRFRPNARDLENDEYDNDRTMYNSLLAESILRDRILAFANDTEFEQNEFEPTDRPGRSYDILTIQLSCPRDIGDFIISESKNATYVPKDYARRVHFNTVTEEFVLRKLILGDER
jgi:hypothetical protein